MRSAALLLGVLLAGCCPDPPARRFSGLEHETQAWLEGSRDPGPGNVLTTVERVFFEESQQESVELLWRYTGRGVSAGSSEVPWGRAAETAEGFSAELKALERSGKTKGRQTLSACAIDGGEAEIFLGTEEAFTPFVYAGRLVGASLARRRVGVSLLVRTRVEPGGVVALDLVPRFSALDGSGGVLLEEARTSVRARPGVPLMIGGGSSASSSLDHWLFGASSREGEKRSVMLLTVRVGAKP